MARSEDNAVGNLTFPDLNLTSYPDKIDSRVEGDPGFNTNMSGYTNLKDYNMAEHVNALGDATMSMERILGINPHIDRDGVNRTTVDQRLYILEDPTRYDLRYGGAGWILSQTLVGHTHTGGPGHPSQIDLTKEVKNKLGKNNIDLSNDKGLTGADITMSPGVSTSIADSVNDKLSTSQGGTVSGEVVFKERVQLLTEKHFNVEDNNNGTVISDPTTRQGKSLRGGGTEDVRIIHKAMRDLEYGKYVMAVRLRVSSLANYNVAYFRMYNRLNNSWVANNIVNLKGTDFDEAGKWKMFYMVFDAEGDAESSYCIAHVGKHATAGSVNIDFDYGYIVPAHPAVFDR